MHLIAASPSPDSGLPVSTLAACQHRVSELWGLYFPPERWRDLVRHLHVVADELNINLAACVNGLLSEPPLPHVLAQCVAEFTVGETYFLRAPDLFSKLGQTVLAPLIGQRRAGLDFRLRLWSAGCCTGEEAYTLAILLGELLPDPACWQVSITASDINPVFLAKAREGLFGNWSFRQVAEGWRQRHFVQEGNRWRINDNYRNSVTFIEHNLVETRYPDPARGLAECDVILCRNVLMYFDPAQAVSALRRMLTCLRPGGVLLLAPAEGLVCQWAGLLPELWPGALCLRQASGRQNMASSVPSSAECLLPLFPFRSADSEPRVYKIQVNESPLKGEPDKVTQDRESNPTLKEQARAAANTARACANRHQLQEALDWLEHAFTLDRLEPSLYWLLASLQIEQGAPQQARSTLRKAIYLQPDFVMAHYLCGLLGAGLGEMFNASRDWKNCLHLLERFPENELLPEAEGLSVQDLKNLIRDALGKAGDGR